jgi:hypothetical protein
MTFHLQILKDKEAMMLMNFLVISKLDNLKLIKEKVEPKKKRKFRPNSSTSTNLKNQNQLSAVFQARKTTQIEAEQINSLIR